MPEDLDFLENSNDSSPAFNMAISYLAQINYLLMQANQASMMDEHGVHAWRKCLMALFRALHPVLLKCKKGELEQAKELRKDIENESMKFNNKMNMIKNNRNFKPMAIQSNIHNKLDELHTLFYDIAYEKGLLMPETDDPRYARLH